MKRKYLQYPLSQEEEEFPLAYSMVVHHKVWKSQVRYRIRTSAVQKMMPFKAVLERCIKKKENW